MCGVCGCGNDEVRINGQSSESEHIHFHSSHHDHAAEAQSLRVDPGLAHTHETEAGHSRLLRIEQDILAKNDALAAGNRARFGSAGVLSLNLVSSPGAGKTTLLVATIAGLRDRAPVAVIEGDQETANDAERIRQAGIPAIQINTGRGCHLDAHMIAHAVEALPLAPGGILFIENVGNLVCPATFDLGEDHKVTILSVTEGEDKPLKYPDMFAAADLMILNKTDLLPHVDFDVARCVDYARQINPAIETIQLSARSGEGLDAWLDWIAQAQARAGDRRMSALPPETHTHA